MNIKFNQQQMDLLKQLNICGDNISDFSETDLDKIEDAVSEKLQIDGFDKDYNVTEIGKICESILDLIADL